MELGIIAKQAVYAGSDDWVSLGELASFVTGWKMASSDAEAIPIALDVIREVVGNGMMEIGTVGYDGFRPWDKPIGESLEYIRSRASSQPLDEWLHVAWLQNTARGNEYAETIDPDELLDDD